MTMVGAMVGYMGGQWLGGIIADAFDVSWLGSGLISVIPGMRADLDKALEATGGGQKRVREEDIPKENVPSHAAGTKSAAPGLALVGEKGPELVNLRGGEAITPTDQLKGGELSPMLLKQIPMMGSLMEIAKGEGPQADQAQAQMQQMSKQLGVSTQVLAKSMTRSSTPSAGGEVMASALDPLMAAGKAMLSPILAPFEVISSLFSGDEGAPGAPGEAASDPAIKELTAILLKAFGPKSDFAIASAKLAKTADKAGKTSPGPNGAPPAAAGLFGNLFGDTAPSPGGNKDGQLGKTAQNQVKRLIDSHLEERFDLSKG